MTCNLMTSHCTVLHKALIFYVVLKKDKSLVITFSACLCTNMRIPVHDCMLKQWPTLFLKFLVTARSYYILII